MPPLSVSRSILIQAPIDRVYASVRSLRDWPKWSPWLLIDPDCQQLHLEDGHGFAWEGPVAGEGRVEIVHEERARLLRLKLTFLKPWKGEAEAVFEFRDLGSAQGFDVTWTMTAPTSFGGIRGAAQSAAQLGSDCERGLAMLKGFIETGSVPSKLSFPGRVFFAGGHYVGIRGPIPIADARAVTIPATFAKLEAWIGEQGVSVLGPRVLVCHRWDLVKGTGDLTVARPVGDGTVKSRHLPSKFGTFDIPSGSAEIVRHTGPYALLGNAWSAAMARVNGSKYRSDPAIDPFEVFENDPATLPSEGLITALYVPLK